MIDRIDFFGYFFSVEEFEDPNAGRYFVACSEDFPNNIRVSASRKEDLELEISKLVQSYYIHIEEGIVDGYPNLKAFVVELKAKIDKDFAG